MQGAKRTGSQDRQFGSENEGKRLEPRCLDPGRAEDEDWKEKRGLGEPRSLGSEVAASQNSRISVHSPLLFPPSGRGEGRRGLEKGSNHGFSPQVAT